jgi:hypothetical protein
VAAGSAAIAVVAGCTGTAVYTISAVPAATAIYIKIIINFKNNFF